MFFARSYRLGCSGFGLQTVALVSVVVFFLFKLWGRVPATSKPRLVGLGYVVPGLSLEDYIFLLYNRAID